ncbi:MAG: CocE/NonD family hydrolase C-terminal non-catalytic domain-containing protein [Planctomycetota bacterium]
MQDRLRDLCLMLLCLPLALAAQGKDPKPPSGGFKLVQQLDQSITYGDSARTLVDVRYPEATPGVTGWPVVIVVHGLGGNRKGDAGLATSIARLGYLTAIYDVRGQGDFNQLNKVEFGTQIIGKVERLDLVEIVAFVGKKYGGGPAPIADMNRLGIAGHSQGGAHAWAAAAWSGSTLPPNSRGLTRFPTFKVACPAVFPPFTADLALPGRASVHNQALAALFLAPSIRFEKQFGDTMKSLIGQERYAEAAAVLDNDPFRQDLKKLRLSKVPVFVAVGWNDSWVGVDKTLAALSVMPTKTPTCAVLDPSTAHEMPTNLARNRANEILCERWLARFLKDDRNGVDTEARFRSSLIQPTSAAETDPKSLQWTRHYDAWPPTGNQVCVFYLRQNQALSRYRPTNIEQPATVDHKVAKGFDLAGYQMLLAFALLTNTDPVVALKQAIPLDSEAHDSVPLDADMEIAGAPRVRLQINKTTATRLFQVHAGLYQVTPGGKERMLGSGMALLQNNSNAKLALDIHIVPIQVRLRKGDRIRLRIQNLAHRTPAAQRNLWVAPYFVTASFQVHKGPARPSHLDLPVRAVVQPALMTATVDVSVAKPQSVVYSLETPTGGTANMAGSPYRILFALSGHGPGVGIGILLPGSDPLRLNFDALTTAMLGLGGPILVGGSGQIPASGKATPTLNLQQLSLSASLIGVRLSAAAVVLPKLGLVATNPQDVFLR